VKKKRLVIPAALAVALLATACPSEPEEPHGHEFCFCDTSDRHPDAGSAAGPDSGCMAPSERVCETV